MSGASVDVVLVTWNSREDTLAALESVEADLRASALEATITVVDNGSVDGTAAAVLERHPSARVLRLAGNRGFTGGIAHGLAASRAEHVVLLNNDAVVERGWLAAFVKSMGAAPPDVVAVSGRILDTSGSRIDFVGGVLTFDGHAFQKDFRRTVGSVAEPEDGAELLFACGGNMIARRREFLDLGGFDDDYFAYLEDVDFGWRSWLSGHRVLYARDAVVRHKSSATSDRIGSFERGVLFERNALQTALKNYDDDFLHEAGGSLFLAYLHRLHHYATTRNGDASELTRGTLGDPASPAPPRESLRARLARRIRGAGRATVLDDGLTAMQFRAFDWLLRNEARVMEKRAAVQARRRRSDREIFEKFPMHFVPTYPGDGQLMASSLFRALRPRVRSVDSTLEEIMQR